VAAKVGSNPTISDYLTAVAQRRQRAQASTFDDSWLAKSLCVLGAFAVKNNYELWIELELRRRLVYLFQSHSDSDCVSRSDIPFFRNRKTNGNRMRRIRLYNSSN
jgi:hypothetical protein